MGQATSSCFKGAVGADAVPERCSQSPVALKPALATSNPPAAAPAQPASDGAVAPLVACCLGAARQPGAPYDVTVSGPPLPGCEADRLEESHLGELVQFAPKEELQNILSLVCNMFSVENALVSLFFDRRVYIIDGTGAFTEGDFPWRYSMCGWTMASERHCVMIVNDVTQDARFCASPVAKELGVRFYVGAPLVSSAGHRLGTLCFADSKPRVFDDSSLKLLCNFSELVTRALERDIIVAHHQQTSRPGEALRELEQKHRYRMLLRSIDCVNSAVLLVDTGTTGWVVRYANSGWHAMLQRQRQAQATKQWVTSAAGGSAGQQALAAAGAVAAAQQAGAGQAEAAAAADDAGSRLLGDSPEPGVDGIEGMLLFPVIERQLAKEADGGSSMLQQLQQLLATRQPFSLHGLELDGSGATTVSLVFRSAGVSDIEGAVSICVPSWVPQPGSVPAAAASLQATAADKAPPGTACPPWYTLYFVTAVMEAPQERRLRMKLPGTQASTCGTFSVGSRRSSNDSIDGHPASSSASSSSSLSLSVPAAGQFQEGAARCVYDDSNLVLLSRMSSQPSHTASSNSNSSNVQASGSNSFSNNSNSHVASSLVGSCMTSITSVSAAAAARAVCRKIEGLHVGGLIASGSYGRVYRGDYYGSTVAVKVLESDSVLRREAVTGLCLEALLGEKFRHPNIIATLAWAVVTGKSKMAAGKRLWGETLDPSKPSIADNKAAIAAGNSDAQQQQQQQQGTQGSARNSCDNMASVSQQLPPLSEEEDSNSLVTAETWLVLEYCNKGCLQDAIDRGWLCERPGGPISLVKVVVTAAEIAAGMYTLHKADVVHGDLSPYNVLLSGLEPTAAAAGRGFVAKISDFGLSRPMGGQSKMLTKTYGTITHMGPETLEHGITSKAVDVYSFGVLLWQMLAGSRAWAGLSHHGVVHAVCVKKQRLQFPAGAPEALVALGQSCMAYEPEDRPTFTDILGVLTPLRDYVSQALAAH